ncbi:MAG: hypothetical protein AB7F59_09915 [Bdellovibrionales bacterium]
MRFLFAVLAFSFVFSSAAISKIQTSNPASQELLAITIGRNKPMDVERVKALLTQGADVNVRGPGGVTPPHLCDRRFCLRQFFGE